MKTSDPTKLRPSPALSDPFLKFADKVRPRVERLLKKRLDAQLKLARRLGPEAAMACQAFVDTCLRGGKRLRAALLVAGGQCFGRLPEPQTLAEMGAAIEVLHTYFLVHDDWIDGDLVRRGGPSAHAQLRAAFGPSLGDAAGVLAGDWGSLIATQWMTALPLSQLKMARILAAFAEMQHAAIGGQLRDLLATDTRVEQTYRLKTASYTVEGPLVMGALSSGASRAELEVIRKFANPAGIAFQLRDDIIGLFAAPKITGKPFASDLRAGKRTLIMNHALDAARGEHKRVITRAFGNPRATERQLRDAVKTMDDIGSRTYVENRILQLIDEACHHLNRPQVSAKARAILTSATYALAVRSS